MLIELNEEQVALRNSLSKFLNDKFDFAKRQEILNSNKNPYKPLWDDFIKTLGIIPGDASEEDTKIETQLLNFAIIMEELGRKLVVDPFLETAIVGASILSQIENDTCQHVLNGISNGSVITAFAWAEPDSGYGLNNISTTAIKEENHWVLNGVKTVVNSAPIASHIIICAQTQNDVTKSSGLSLFLVETDILQDASFSYDTIDNRRAADYKFVDTKLPETALIAKPEQAVDILNQVIDLATLSLCSEAIGVMKATIETTIEYTQDRRQFGQPLSNFQALQHRMVDMFMELNQAVSATDIALKDFESRSTENRLSISLAKTIVGSAARFIGQNAVQLHGGMGMCDETKVGQLFKRLTVIENSFGDKDYHFNKLVLAHKSHNSSSTATAKFNDEYESFREEIRHFFQTEYPKSVIEKHLAGAEITKEDHIQSQRSLQSRGWLGFLWPKECGGPGWDPIQRYIFEEELDRAGALNIIPMGVIYAGPVICTFGSEAQKKQWLPDILESKSMWAQGYSEPESGSDLASLKFRADRDGDEYILNGTKTWTSLAQWADWIFLLARTSDAPRKAGISFICAKLDSPGVTVHPISTIDGIEHLNTVEFENVRVPASNLIGEEGKGWEYSMFLLANERLSYAHISLKKEELKSLRELASVTPSELFGHMANDPSFEFAMTQCELKTKIAENAVLKVLLAGQNASLAEVAALKINVTELAQDISELYLRLGKRHIAVKANRKSKDWAKISPESHGFAQSKSATYFTNRAQSIYGGSNEIQKNIIWKAISRSNAI